MSFVNFVIKRSISTSAVRNGKRNFRKFQLFNKRGHKVFKEQQRGPNPLLPIHSKIVELHGVPELLVTLFFRTRS